MSVEQLEVLHTNIAMLIKIEEQEFKLMVSSMIKARKEVLA